MVVCLVKMDLGKTYDIEHNELCDKCWKSMDYRMKSLLT